MTDENSRSDSSFQALLDAAVDAIIVANDKKEARQWLVTNSIV